MQSQDWESKEYSIVVTIIAANYRVGGEKFNLFIRKYLKLLVASGSLVQAKEKGVLAPSN